MSRVGQPASLEALFQTGKKDVGQYVVLYRLSVSTEGKHWFIASKKVGNSVKRHRAKRLLREAFWAMKKKMPIIPYDVALVARPRILNVKCQDVLAELIKLWGIR